MTKVFPVFSFGAFLNSLYNISKFLTLLQRSSKFLEFNNDAAYSGDRAQSSVMCTFRFSAKIPLIHSVLLNVHWQLHFRFNIPCFIEILCAYWKKKKKLGRFVPYFVLIFSFRVLTSAGSNIAQISGWTNRNTNAERALYDQFMHLTGWLCIKRWTTLTL